MERRPRRGNSRKLSSQLRPPGFHPPLLQRQRGVRARNTVDLGGGKKALGSQKVMESANDFVDRIRALESFDSIVQTLQPLRRLHMCGGLLGTTGHHSPLEERPEARILRADRRRGDQQQNTDCPHPGGTHDPIIGSVAKTAIPNC